MGNRRALQPYGLTSPAIGSQLSAKGQSRGWVLAESRPLIADSWRRQRYSQRQRYALAAAHAVLACSHRLANAVGSLAAISARIFRSSSSPDFFSPLMNRL